MNIHILIVFLLVLISGTPAIRQYQYYEYLPLLLSILTSFIYRTNVISFLRSSSIYFISVILIFIFQYLTFDFISLLGSINLLVKIYLAGLIYYAQKDTFRKNFFYVMYFFSLVSIIVFPYTMLTNSAPDFMGMEQFKSIGIYNQKVLFNGSFLPRNSGPFWEPGAFAGYLLLCIALYINDINYLWKTQKFKFIIVIAAFITTFSTTGYLTLFICIIIKMILSAKTNIATYIALLFFTISSFIIYTQFDFLGEKINSQINETQKYNQEFSNKRMGAFIFDLHYIEKHPLTGNGWHARTRWADHPILQNQELSGETLGHGNGFSNFLASMGCLFVLFYFYLIYRNLSFSPINKIVFIVFLIIILQGEQYLLYPIFLGLPLYRTVYNQAL